MQSRTWSSPTSPAAPLRYTVALGVVLIALLISLLLRPLVLLNPFIFFFAAVAISAWYGGLGPGLFATALSALFASYAFIEPIGSFLLAPFDIVRLFVFVFVATLISALSDSRRRAMVAAQAQREHLHVTLASIGDAVIATDAQGQVTFLNPIAETLTGWTQAAALGQPIDQVFRIIDASTRQPVEVPVARVLREGTIVGLANHTLLIARDGAEHAIDDSGAPIRGPSDELIGVVLVFRDIGERQRAEAARLMLLEREQAARADAEASRARLGQLYGHTARLYSISAALSAALTPVEVAEVMLSQGGAALGAVGGVVMLLAPGDAELALLSARGYPDDLLAAYRRLALGQPGPLTDALRSGEPVLIESREVAVARYPDLAVVHPRIALHAWANVPLMLSGRPVGALELSFDAPRQLSEDERAFLIALAQQCAQALDRARLFEAERQARAEAEAAVRLRDVFLSVASHELKTPLTALNGQAQLLQRRLLQATPRDDRYLQSVDVVVAQVRRLNTMVATLLDVSRIEQGQLSIERAPLDLTALARRVVDETRLTLSLHTMTFVGDEPLPVLGDELRLEQVLNNLLSNAVKYSPSGGEVRVLAERRASQACVTVSDQGIGIPPDAIPHLFTRFYRAANAERRQMSGMGIGLHVVKEIVALHSGTVTVESVEGQGSAFTIALPLAPALAA